MLHMEKTLFEEISDAYPNMDNTRIRNVLAAFLFTGDDVFKRIKDLSGGERGRVSLAKLMLSEANFLILGRAHQPSGHHLQGNPGIRRLNQLHRHRPVRVPRPVFHQPDGHPDSGAHRPDAGQLHRQLRLLPGEKGGADPHSSGGPGRDRCLRRLPPTEPDTEAKLDWQQQKGSSRPACGKSGKMP